MFCTVLIALSLLAADTDRSAIPFPPALQRADIRQERLDDVLENAMVLGNGDINALVYSRGGNVVISLTKNDVWDARLLTEKDPPLPTVKRLKALAAEGWPKGGDANWILPDGQAYDGQDSYHAHPFPCPLQCAEVVLQSGIHEAGDEKEPAQWEAVRAEGTLNEFVQDGTKGIMRIEGKAGSSNGFRCALDLPLEADYAELSLRVRGTANARFFVDLMDENNRPCFSSGWLDTPRTVEDVSFNLPKDKAFTAIILYTWTKDGALAATVFEKVAFTGNGPEVSLTLGSPPSVPMPSHLSLEKAVAEIKSVPGKSDGTVIRTLADKNVFLIETAASARLRAVTPDFLPPPDLQDGAEVSWIMQEVKGDLDWPGMRYAVALARGEGATAVSIVTSLESDTPREDAVTLAAATLAEDRASLIERHEAAWRDFWSASGVSMPDMTLEQNWYRSLYFLRCVSKPGVVSPGLFAGLINATPAWHGDYHLNYNLQQTFWSAYITNHCDLAEPYDRLILEYLPRAIWLARQVYDCEGAFYPHVLFAYEPADPEACKSVNGRQYIHHVWGLTLGVAGFAVQPLWWRYKYAPDPELLRKVTYPPLREVARFYAAFIQACDRVDGVVRLGPSVSPEHWGWTENLDRNYDCAFDIAMARYTLEAAIEAAGILLCDADLVQQWREALPLLPPYPATGGDAPVVVDVAGAPPTEYNISVPATPVYPGDMITWWSAEEEQKLFTRTVDTLEWNGNNATFMLAISRARLGMPKSADWLRDEILARQRPNGTLTLNRLGHHFNTFGHYTEQFGAAQAVSELLLQSEGDIVRVLPAWPPESPVRFHQLRAQGGFLVSGGCEAGRLLPVRVLSIVGGALRIASPWKQTTVQRGDKTQPATPEENGIITLDTRPGEVVVIDETAS